MLPSPALIQSIGQKLMAARLERGLEVEDVSFKTHIPAALVRDLENDDLTNFASPAYARGFLKIYYNFLNLDPGESADEVGIGGYANSSGHNYIQSANAGMTSLDRAGARPRRESVRGGIWFILLMLTGLIAIPVLHWNRPAEPVPATRAPTLDPPKARVIEPGVPIGTSATATESELEIKSATPASIRAKVIPEDPVEAPASPRNDVTNPPSPDDEDPPAALKNSATTSGVQVRKALSEVAGDPPPNR